MTYYKYYDEITNTNEVKDFFNKKNIKKKKKKKIKKGK